MKTADKFIVLVTTPDLKTARRIIQKVLENKLAACANLIPKIESHYWWQGKIEQGNEVLILIKTAKAKLPALEKIVLANHPYDTPEFVVLSIQSGNKRYLQWLDDSLAT